MDPTESFTICAGPTVFRQRTSAMSMTSLPLAARAARHGGPRRGRRRMVAEQLGRLADELLDRPPALFLDHRTLPVLLDQVHLAAGHDEALARDVRCLLGAQVDDPWSDVVGVPGVEALGLRDVAERPL